MSLLSGLKPKEGSTHYRKRVGRGIGSGLGGTAAKGHKGQLARTGGKVRRGFEGGQSPLSRRLPKFGFTNISFKTVYDTVSLSQLEALGQSSVTIASLVSARLVRKGRPVKVLANGKLTKSISIEANGFSSGAQKMIESVGGKAIVVALAGSKSKAAEAKQKQGKSKK